MNTIYKREKDEYVKTLRKSKSIKASWGPNHMDMEINSLLNLSIQFFSSFQTSNFAQKIYLTDIFCAFVKFQLPLAH